MHLVTQAVCANKQAMALVNEQQQLQTPLQDAQSMTDILTGVACRITNSMHAPFPQATDFTNSAFRKHTTSTV